MTLFYLLDLIGTFVFALAGSFKAIRHKFDLLGIFILAAITGTGGGIIRDLILGYTPPASLQNMEYILVCIAAGVISFLFPKKIYSKQNVLTVLDAIGLGVFVYIGAEKAISMDMNFLSVVFCGTVTGVGGGVIRDILVNEISTILNSEFYATSAIIGSSYLFLFHGILNDEFLVFSTIFFTTIIRLITWRYRVELPVNRVDVDL